MHGFTFLASVVAIFSGAQMFALGIIGEYLSRIHFRTMAATSLYCASPHCRFWRGYLMRDALIGVCRIRG